MLLRLFSKLKKIVIHYYAEWLLYITALLEVSDQWQENEIAVYLNILTQYLRKCLKSILNFGLHLFPDRYTLTHVAKL